MPIWLIGLGIVAVGLYLKERANAASNGIATVAPNTPVVPPAPPPAVAPTPDPAGIGVTPAQPTTYPGFIGVEPPTQTLAVGTSVTGTWANSAAGAAAPTAAALAGSDATGSQQAVVIGTIQSGDPTGYTVLVTGVLNAYNLPVPSTFVAGAQITAPSTVWSPVSAA